jgi:hypothetical protein
MSYGEKKHSIKEVAEDLYKFEKGQEKLNDETVSMFKDLVKFNKKQTKYQLRQNYLFIIQNFLFIIMFIMLLIKVFYI